ncbi:hypothetical protein M422DRAFT_45373 [Sphaerobolus stellatus SS14]|nr:hypothetical protein M422DRAFT_45373 [Sphaerobolus stellatus SS14]
MTNLQPRLEPAPVDWFHPFQRFPMEIVQKIFQFATDLSPRTGASLSVVSQEVFAWVIPVLYRSPVIDTIQVAASTNFYRASLTPLGRRRVMIYNKALRNVFFVNSYNFQFLRGLSCLRHLALPLLWDRVGPLPETVCETITHLYFTNGFNPYNTSQLRFSSTTHLYAFYPGIGSLNSRNLTFQPDGSGGLFTYLPSLTHVIIAVPYQHARSKQAINSLLDFLGSSTRLVFIGIMLYRRAVQVAPAGSSPATPDENDMDIELLDSRCHLLPFIPCDARTWKLWCDEVTIWDAVMRTSS